MDFQTDQGPLAERILQHTSVLSDLANEARWLGEGSAFFLGLALLRPGLSSLLRGQAAASARTIRWLAILGLISALSACVGQGTLALIDQVLSFPQPGGVLLQLVKMPFLWLGLLGFGGVLWGSFLRSQKVEQPGGREPVAELSGGAGTT